MPQNRYNFVNEGAAASDAFTQYVAQQEALKRQAMLDALTKQKEDRADELQRQNAKDMQHERDFRKASTIHENILPGATSKETFDLLNREGFGSDVVNSPGAEAEAALAMPKVDVKLQGDVPPPDRAALDKELTGSVADLQTTPTKAGNAPGFMSLGGSRYQLGRVAADEKASAAKIASEEKATAAATAASNKSDEAQKDRDLKELLGKMGIDAKADTTALRNELLSLQANGLKTKAEDAATARTNARKSIIDASDRVMESLNQLQDEKTNKLTPGTSSIIGKWRLPETIANMPIVGGGQTADRYAAYNTLRSRLEIDILQELKAATKTGASGFGQLSEAEGKLLMDAAGQLQRSQTPEQFNQQLSVVRRLMTKLKAEPAGASKATGGKYQRTIEN